MVLVDTSVWIDAPGRRPGVATRRLQQLLDANEACAICAVVVQEVLQGARSPREFERMQGYMASLPLLEPESSLATYIHAARIYADCRAAGVTPPNQRGLPDRGNRYRA